MSEVLQEISPISTKNSGESSQRAERSDDLVYQCKFYRSYQLSCRHIFQFDAMNACITQHDWTRWASMSEDSGFEIYETTTRTYAVAEIHEVIEGPVKHVLEMRGSG